MRPQGIDLTPSRLLAVVNGKHDLCLKPDEYDIPEDTPLSVYRHKGGKTYALGRKCDWDLWKQVGCQGMGSVELIWELLKSAEKSGIKEKRASPGIYYAMSSGLKGAADLRKLDVVLYRKLTEAGWKQ